MDLSDPTRAVTPTLDGTVLAVLAAAGKPLTVGQVASLAARGSEIGIRRSLSRLVEQGTVRATTMGRNQVHELNRDHVAAQVAEALAGLRGELWARFRNELDSWRPRPLYACVFGSAARGDGTAESDIDLLLVHPPFQGEKKPQRMSPALSATLADALGAAAMVADDPKAERHWEDQLENLHGVVERWTGNALQIVDLSFWEWRRPPKSYQPLLRAVAADGIELRKARGLKWWPTLEAEVG
jgi:predicted nucleotidyltransferase